MSLLKNVPEADETLNLFNALKNIYDTIECMPNIKDKIKTRR